MKLYHSLSELFFTRKKYALKFFLASLPLVMVCIVELIFFYFMSIGRLNISFGIAVLLMLTVTSIAALTTLYLFNQLLIPLRHAKSALNNYAASRALPQLPIKYQDEAGLLLNNIQETLTELDQLIAEKSDMIDLLSHDLRSPVGRILSLSNLIRTDKETEKSIYANFITNECNSLLRMLENILLMLKENSQVFKLTNVNLKQIIDETVHFFAFAATQKKLSLVVSIDEDIYIPVQQELFMQAVRNIIGNAIKFSPDGKSVFISATQVDDQVSLCIADQGLGFNPIDIQKIFDRFTAAGKKGTHGEASTGLGLYLSKKIVERHGGKLIAESKGPNMGASFTILLYKLITKKQKGRTRIMPEKVDLGEKIITNVMEKITDKLTSEDKVNNSEKVNKEENVNTPGNIIAEEQKNGSEKLITEEKLNISKKLFTPKTVSFPQRTKAEKDEMRGRIIKQGKGDNSGKTKVPQSHYVSNRHH